ADLVFDGLARQVAAERDLAADALLVLRVGHVDADARLSKARHVDLYPAADLGIDAAGLRAFEHLAADANLRPARRLPAHIGPPPDLRLGAGVAHLALDPALHAGAAGAGSDIDLDAHCRTAGRKAARHHVAGEATGDPAIADLKSDAGARLQVRRALGLRD